MLADDLGRATQQTRRHYHELFVNAPDAHVLTDRFGRILEANQAAGRLLHDVPEDLQGRPLSDFVEQSALAHFNNALAYLENGPSNAEWEFTLRPRDGETLEASWQVRVERDETSGIAHVHWVLRDITRRRHAEEQVRQWNAELEARIAQRTAQLESARLEAEAERARTLAILDSITDGFMTIDRERRITYVNPQGKRLIAPIQPDAVGQTMDDAFPREQTRGFYEAVEDAAARSAPVHLEAYYAPLSTWYEVHVYPSRDGLAVYFRDVTERKQAEQAVQFLAEVNRQLAASLDYATTLARTARLAVPLLADYVIIYTTADEGQIQRAAVAHVDPAKELLLVQLPCDPLKHAAQNVMQSAWHEGRPVPLAGVSQEMIGPIPGACEAEVYQKELAPSSVLIAPLIAREQVFGAVVFAIAGSGRRYGPDIQALAEELARRAAVAIDHAHLYLQARSAVRARDEFLSLISHDLKSPLVTIRGNTQLLQRRLKSGKAGVEQTEAVLLRIDRATGRMAMLIDQILDVVRVQLGRPVPLERRPVNLVAMAQRIAEEYRPMSEHHQIRLEHDMPQLIGQWDLSRVERMLSNLVGNAIKYSPGGGEVVVRIEEETRDGGSWAVLQVQDHGIGIPAPDLNHIFEPFRRAGNVPAGIPGTGLGLASARQIVEQHGGLIEVSSQEDVGSTFTVRLPR